MYKPAPLKARIRRTVDKWRTILGLMLWDFDFEYHETPISGHEKAAATCEPQWQYRIATLRFYMYDMHGLTDERFERVIIHELMHCLADGAEEHIVTDLTTAIWFAYKAGKRGQSRIHTNMAKVAKGNS